MLKAFEKETAVKFNKDHSIAEKAPLIDLFFQNPEKFYVRFHSLQRAKSQYAKQYRDNMQEFLELIGKVTVAWAPYVLRHYNQEHGWIISAMTPVTHHVVEGTFDQTFTNTPTEVLRQLDKKSFKEYVSNLRTFLGIKRYDQEKTEQRLLEYLVPKTWKPGELDF